MDLFENQSENPRNRLPGDGVVNYYGRIMAIDQADLFYQRLLSNIEWRNDQAVMFGKTIVTKRKVAWYGDQPFDYTYSNTTKRALPWIKELRELKNMVEDVSSAQFNSCLLNLYHNGTEGMAWHSDAELDLEKYAAIGSLSFGAERKFSFKHKRSKQRVSLILEHGSLLVMKGQTQTHWLHRLPPTSTIDSPRINLTFRSMVK